MTTATINGRRAARSGPAATLDLSARARAAVYLRISSDREGREYGIDRQRPDCLDLAEREGVTVTRIYVDNDKSASTRTNTVRPEYDQMLADAAAGKFSVIISGTSNRLTRRPMEHEGQIVLAEQYGVSYRFVRSPRFDLNTAQGRMIARILAASDTAEAEMISERVIRACQQRAEQGRFHGGRRPYAFAKDGTTVVPKEAAVVVIAARKVMGRESLRGIVGEFRAAGYVTTTGGAWTTKVLRSTLLRIRNGGQVDYRDQIICDASWLPLDLLIDEDGKPLRGKVKATPEAVARSQEWWAALRALLCHPDRVTRTGGAPRWLGSGLFLCGGCGGRLRVKIRKGALAPDSPHYRCPNAGDGARHSYRNVAALDGLVVGLLLERVAATASTPSAPTADLVGLREAVADLHALKGEAVSMFGDGTIDRAEWDALKASYDRRLRAAQAELDAQVITEPYGPLVGVSDPAAAWEDMTIGAQRATLAQLMTVTVLTASGGRGSRFRRCDVDVAWR